ncbi:MAG TPA: DUF4350 domain-containing protein [Sphingobium sp.]
MNWQAGGATALAGVGVLLWGMLPPHVMATGQLDPRDWLVPGVAGLVLLLGLLRWILRRWDWPVVLIAVTAVVLPPVVLCVAGSAGQEARLDAWLHPAPLRLPLTVKRPVVGVLSGPMLRGLPRQGAMQEGFVPTPLWEALSRPLDLRPVDALAAETLARTSTLLVIQPRALAPEELVALDTWVRMGGRAVLLVDPDLRWADARPLGHPLRAPSVTMLGPLLVHWGLKLAPVPPQASGGPVERRIMDDGRMIQIAGASHFLPSLSGCRTESGGLVVRCAVGKGTALLVADADFANDALWTADPADSIGMRAWTSDTVPVLADFLVPGAGKAAGRRIWLAQADGLPGALRMALGVLVILSVAVSATLSRGGRMAEKRGVSQPV